MSWTINIMEGFEIDIASQVAKNNYKIYEYGISYFARTYFEGKKIRYNLLKQLTGSVQWYKTILNMENNGINKIIVKSKDR